MLKNQATTTLAFCASEGVQIFGGAGFMRGVKVERIYREVKVNAIGAGTEEIMKDLASRQMGLSVKRRYDRHCEERSDRRSSAKRAAVAWIASSLRSSQ